jgi:hypothetical protein
MACSCHATSSEAHPKRTAVHGPRHAVCRVQPRSYKILMFTTSPACCSCSTSLHRQPHDACLRQGTKRSCTLSSAMTHWAIANLKVQPSWCLVKHAAWRLPMQDCCRSTCAVGATVICHDAGVVSPDRRCWRTCPATPASGQMTSAPTAPLGQHTAAVAKLGRELGELRAMIY